MFNIKLLNLLIAVTCFILIITSLISAYYIISVLPKQSKINSNEISNTKSNPTSTENIIQDRTKNDNNEQLEKINDQLDEQERDRQMQLDCESGGEGIYQGNGVCVYP